MTRILLVETASPKRIRRTAEDLLQGRIYPGPQITILCTSDPTTLTYFSEIRGVRIVPLPTKQKGSTLAALRAEGFDVLRVFWTGEKKYLRMKLWSLWLRASRVEVESGDAGVFELTWKALPRFWVFRWHHPLPSDHYEFVPKGQDADAQRYYQRERVLIIQSAEPPYVLRALDKVRQGQLFRNPHCTVFCRNTPEIAEKFRGHPLIHHVRTHTEARGSWRHLRELRKERYDGLVVFLTGDPSYWKIKCFAFLIGARHKLIFNENNDCVLFSLVNWVAFLAHRMGERSRAGGGPNWVYQTRLLFFLLIKAALFPFRFAWLLLVWLRLRLAG